MREFANKLEYKYIRRWGKYVKSKLYYVDAQVAAARAENAPEDAVYKTLEDNPDPNETKLVYRWVLFSELKPQLQGVLDYLKGVGEK